MPLPYMAVDVDESDCREYTGPGEYPAPAPRRFPLAPRLPEHLHLADPGDGRLHERAASAAGRGAGPVGRRARLPPAVPPAHHLPPEPGGPAPPPLHPHAPEPGQHRRRQQGRQRGPTIHREVQALRQPRQQRLPRRRQDPFHRALHTPLGGTQGVFGLETRQVQGSGYCRRVGLQGSRAVTSGSNARWAIDPTICPSAWVWCMWFSLASFRPRCRVKKQQWRSASALAKHYREYKLRMPSSSHQELHHGLSSKARSRLADLLDESLKAGRRPELRQRHPLQVTAMESPPFNQATFGILTRPAITSGISSAMNAGTAALQTSSAKTSGIASVTNAGPAALQTSSVKAPGIVSVTNADTNYLTREGSYTESACQGSVSREDQRRARIAFVKKFLNTKRQASREPLVDVKVEAGWPAGAGTSMDSSA